MPFDLLKAKLDRIGRAPGRHRHELLGPNQRPDSRLQRGALPRRSAGERVRPDPPPTRGDRGRRRLRRWHAGASPTRTATGFGTCGRSAGGQVPPATPRLPSPPERITRFSTQTIASRRRSSSTNWRVAHRPPRARHGLRPRARIREPRSCPRGTRCGPPAGSPVALDVAHSMLHPAAASFERVGPFADDLRLAGGRRLVRACDRGRAEVVHAPGGCARAPSAHVEQRCAGTRRAARLSARRSRVDGTAAASMSEPRLAGAFWPSRHERLAPHRARRAAARARRLASTASGA